MQADKQAFTAEEFREAIKEFATLVGHDERLRRSLQVDLALDYVNRLKPARAVDETDGKGSDKRTTWYLVEE
ncbi:hypothetical protein bAD24_III10470 [Burkholderia sp. AD24]|nr:hypothetical protein bAD24_III10470 [Burkholderia sp. AD24]